MRAKKREEQDATRDLAQALRRLDASRAEMIERVDLMLAQPGPAPAARKRRNRTRRRRAD